MLAFGGCRFLGPNLSCESWLPSFFDLALPITAAESSRLVDLVPPRTVVLGKWCFTAHCVWGHSGPSCVTWHGFITDRHWKYHPGKKHDYNENPNNALEMGKSSKQPYILASSLIHKKNWSHFMIPKLSKKLDLRHVILLSKTKCHLTNGPLRKLLELLDPQVLGVRSLGPVDDFFESWNRFF